MKISVVLADDHQLVREGIAALLATIEGVRVLAQARDGHELLAILRAVHPDVVLTDIVMPEMDGLQAIGRIRVEHPWARVVVLSMTDTDDCVKQAVSLGACGYLRKDASVEQLQHALQCVMTTGSYFPAEVARKLMSKPGQGTDDLTARQLEILRQIANGRTSKEIAHELNLSPKTVDVHRGRIMERLNIHDVPGLTRYAMRVGLLEP